MHAGKDGKDWAAIAALVQSRTKNQCVERWKNTLDPSIVRPVRLDMWTPAENKRLKDSVQMHGGKNKNWVAIVALFPGRTKRQCSSRWRNVLNPSIALTAGLRVPGQDRRRRPQAEACDLHGGKDGKDGKDWAAIAVITTSHALSIIPCLRK
jgi:hypothetical protein